MDDLRVTYYTAKFLSLGFADSTHKRFKRNQRDLEEFVHEFPSLSGTTTQSCLAEESFSVFEAETLIYLSWFVIEKGKTWKGLTENRSHWFKKHSQPNSSVHKCRKRLLDQLKRGINLCWTKPPKPKLVIRPEQLLFLHKAVGRRTPFACVWRIVSGIIGLLCGRPIELVQTNPHRINKRHPPLRWKHLRSVELDIDDFIDKGQRMF